MSAEDTALQPLRRQVLSGGISNEGSSDSDSGCGAGVAAAVS